jgi:hypothetical protein
MSRRTGREPPPKSSTPTPSSVESSAGCERARGKKVSSAVWASFLLLLTEIDRGGDDDDGDDERRPGEAAIADMAAAALQRCELRTLYPNSLSKKVNQRSSVMRRCSTAP